MIECCLGLVLYRYCTVNMDIQFFVGRVSSLEYFILTSPTYLPRDLDGSSDAIYVPGGFSFGSHIFYFIYVRRRDYI